MATRYANRTLEEESLKYSVLIEKIEEFKLGMKNLVDSAAELQVEIGTPGSLVKRDSNITELYELLSAEIDKVIVQLMDEFHEPLPEDQTERSRMREEAVTRALDMIEEALVKVYGH